MSRHATLIVVAIGAFAFGMVIDRLVFAPGSSGSASAHSPQQDGRPSAKGKPSPVPHGRRIGSRGHDGKGNGRAASAGDGSVRDILEQLEHDERIDYLRVSELVAKLPPSEERQELVRRLAHRWGRHDPESALAWIDQLTGREKQEALHHALHAWAEHDPAAAAGYAASLPRTEHHRHILREMAHRWAEQDREAAIAWSLDQPHPATRGTALSGVMHFWAEHDPAGAAGFAMGLEDDYERNRSLEVVARRWAHEDADGALEWARGLENDTDWHLATIGILREVAARDPVRAAAVYGELTAQENATDRHINTYRQLAREVAHIWSASSPREAAQWAVNLPEGGDVRRSAVAHAVEHWHNLDREAAGEWVLQLPAGRTRDEAAARIVHHTADRDPQTAFTWASQVRDPGHQVGLMNEVLKRWSSSDPTAARAAYQAADLNADQRRELDRLFPAEVPAPAPDEPPGE